MPTETRIGPDDASIGLVGGGRLELRRSTLTAHYQLPRALDDEELLHPYLAAAAAVASSWLGRVTLHGGLLARDGRALALVGDKESGKSTLLGWLALHATEVDVLADDLVVLDGAEVQAGPRLVDLRPGTAALLGDAATTPSRGATRERLHLPSASGDATLAGVVELVWGTDDEQLERISPGERPALLESNRPFAADLPLAGGLLDLVPLPAWRLSRRRDMTALPATAARLLALLD